jgi:PEP-CTERM motif
MKLHPLLALALAMAPGAAFASSITTATVYENTPDSGNASDPSNFASTLASANFTIGALGINFETNDSPSTPLSTFLNNPTFSNLANGFDSSVQTNNSEIVITGFITLNSGNNAFVVGHDDGVVLNIAGFGNVVNAPGPTALDDTSFNVPNPGAGGDFAFTLEYAETDGGPADLIFNINNTLLTTSPVPEPGSMVLLGTGMLGLAGVVRRRFLTR